jgi:hypothetical protein
MEKHCDDCRLSGKNNNGIWCGYLVSECYGQNFKYFIPIEPKHSADDYEILRDCTLDTLIEDGKCFEALKLYKIMPFSSVVSAEEKLKYLFEHKHDYNVSFSEIIKYLIENKYIKKKERKPEVGDVFESQLGMVLVLKKRDYGFSCYCFRNNCVKDYVLDSKDFWKRIGKLKDMI